MRATHDSFIHPDFKQFYYSPYILKLRDCYCAVDKLYCFVICNVELLLQETPGNAIKKVPAMVWMVNHNFSPLHTNRCLVLRKNDQLNVCSSFIGMCCYEQAHVITVPKPCLYSKEFVFKKKRTCVFCRNIWSNI